MRRVHVGRSGGRDPVVQARLRFGAPRSSAPSTAGCSPDPPRRRSKAAGARDAPRDGHASETQALGARDDRARHQGGTWRHERRSRTPTSALNSSAPSTSAYSIWTPTRSRRSRKEAPAPVHQHEHTVPAARIRARSIRHSRSLSSWSAGRWRRCWPTRPPTTSSRLRVIDPAMGSGAFLVAACRYSVACVRARARERRPLRGNGSRCRHAREHSPHCCCALPGWCGRQSRRGTARPPVAVAHHACA